MEGWEDGRMEGWKDERMDGWKDGRMEGWKDGNVVRFNGQIGACRRGEGSQAQLIKLFNYIRCFHNS